MRIISGTAKSKLFRTVRGMRVRPTSDRTREAVFNILGDSVENARVLDLFAGSGALGMEAISRGARFAVFVEKTRSVALAIKKNLGQLDFQNAEVFSMDVFKFLKLFSKKMEKFDFIFADPPYRLFDHLWIEDLWAGVDELLHPDGTFILEHPAQWTPPEKIVDLEHFDDRTYGQTQISFFRS